MPARSRRKTSTSGKAVAVREAPTGLATDLLILSSRLAVTPAPVFWASGELAARTAPAVDTGADWDGNYAAALPDYGTRDGEAGPWEWYDTHPWCPECYAELRHEGEPHEPCDIPVVVLTVTKDGPPRELPDAADPHIAAIEAAWDEEGMTP